MTGAVLELHYDDAEIRAAMGRLQDFSGERMNAAWNAIGGKMVTATQLRFDMQRGPSGAPWKPSKRAVKDGGKTLIWHGYLLASITYNVIGDGVEWGSNLAYAAAMQGGATIQHYARSQQIYRSTGRDGIKPRFVRKSKSNFSSWATIGEHTVTIEGRPYLGVNADDVVEINDTLAAHLEAAILGTPVGHA